MLTDDVAKTMDTLSLLDGLALAMRRTGHERSVWKDSSDDKHLEYRIKDIGTDMGQLSNL